MVFEVCSHRTGSIVGRLASEEGGSLLTLGGCPLMDSLSTHTFVLFFLPLPHPEYRTVAVDCASPPRGIPVKLSHQK